MWQGNLKKLGRTYIDRLPYARLRITYLSAECTENMKLKRRNDYQWDNSSDFFKKTNIEEKLVSEIGNEFQIEC